MARKVLDSVGNSDASRSDQSAAPLEPDVREGLIRYLEQLGLVTRVDPPADLTSSSGSSGGYAGGSEASNSSGSTGSPVGDMRFLLLSRIEGQPLALSVTAQLGSGASSPGSPSTTYAQAASGGSTGGDVSSAIFDSTGRSHGSSGSPSSIENGRTIRSAQVPAGPSGHYIGPDSYLGQGLLLPDRDTSQDLRFEELGVTFDGGIRYGY